MSSASDPNPDVTTAEPVPIRLVLTAVAMTLFFASLGQTIVSTALPLIVADLGGVDHITWAITAYLLASTVGAPISGKLGDLYGRKIVMQAAIGVFVIGAVLCGTAGSMGQLIAGRAVQGLGGGSLIVLSMAVVGDVLPARERGKAQGMLGAAFGLSTIIGPLAGGFIVQTLGWHWIFFVNLPVGVAALAILAVALPGRVSGKSYRIDYVGALSLAVLLSTAVLIANLGGSVLPWGSAGFLSLVGLFVLAVGSFVWAEARAEEPILPLRLFTINTFLVVNGVGFMVGVAMFGTITFLPLYLQIAKGVSPTASGLFLLPMMGGLIGGSTLSGQIMSRTGRYKLLPTLSTAVLACAMLFMTTLSGTSPLWAIAIAMLGVGIGLGPVFAVGVAAIQNAVPQQMMGVGTASANMFRLIGGSLGTALFGALFASGLAGALEGRFPEAAGQGGLRSMSAEMLDTLPAAARAEVIEGISQALHPVFMIGAVVAVIACVLSTRLEELPLSSVLPGR
ncbi:MDR family MFS transporter [Nioella nitratireducens]|uniref:MDR family MFS transporter n=1 Tax=Nioella nitratireducens TaxID=1287720 RepID=UPI0008FD26BC|nr:MDR family MFS transporter [Nioella nitratireducens]